MADLYAGYKADAQKAIRQSIQQMGCQPILFVGSGLSKRYFGAPNWDDLLVHMASHCPAIDREYGYYKQKYAGDMPKIGSVFAEAYREWAWSKAGRPEFPKELFQPGYASSIYLKYKVAQFIKSITPTATGRLRPVAYRREIDALRTVQPHALISTNYDQFLEVVFDGFSPVIGQQILRTNYVSIGEVFKIHGCASAPETLVLTDEDYVEWTKRKKYLSAKLLTYFAEHPLVFLGYSASDSNVRAILSDIDEILAEQDGLVGNLFFLHYVPNAEELDDLPSERLIDLGEGRTVRVRNIDASDFLWVFEALSSGSPIERVNPKLLRALLARNYDLVRHDIPRRTVQVDFTTLEHAVGEDGNLAQLLGISTLDDPKVFNAAYPYTLTGVAEQLGYGHWTYANQLLDRIKNERGIDIKAFDNKYHIKVKIGHSVTSVTKKYSQHCADLLEAVRDGAPYEIDTSLLAPPTAPDD